MINITLHKEVKRLYQPKLKDFTNWITASLQSSFLQVNIDILIVNSDRSLYFNDKYRNKPYPTNVISLEYKESRTKFNILSGELILCDEVITNEAVAAQKTIFAHYAHMVIHGVLHMQGFDHQADSEAQIMESCEEKILRQLSLW